jgi:hypothetical protein
MKTQMRSLLSISLAVILLAACSSPLIQGTPTPSPIPPQTGDGGLTITLADNGKTIEMKVGDTALLKLGYEYDWNISITDESILSRVKNIMVINGAQGVYQALKAGTTVMSISGDPVCRVSTPPCMMPSIQFQVTIVVK